MTQRETEADRDLGIDPEAADDPDEPDEATEGAKEQERSAASKGDKAPTARPRWQRVARVGAQVLLVLAVLWGVGEWQSRKLLASRTPAPDFTLRSLDGQSVGLRDAAGRKVVLYFFAPWCTACNLTSHNVVALRDARSEQELAVYAIGLGWESVGELEQFARDHDLNMPVLQGGDQIAGDYRISAFPTVYVIDENGSVETRVVGYTTELGLRLRSL